MIYFYGDSFTTRHFSSNRLEVWLTENNISYDSILDEIVKRHWTGLLSRKIKDDYTITAVGGWSNQDILVRVLRDLSKFTSKDTVVVLASESTRVMMPANLRYTEQQTGEAGISTRAKGYPMISVPSSLLAKEYENSIGTNMEDMWLSGLSYYSNITLPYSNEIQKYYVDLALKPLIEHIDSNICRSIVFTNKLWPEFSSWADLGEVYENDKHWNTNGWKDFSNFAYKVLQSKQTFVQSVRSPI